MDRSADGVKCREVTRSDREMITPRLPAWMCCTLPVHRLAHRLSSNIHSSSLATIHPKMSLLFISLFSFCLQLFFLRYHSSLSQFLGKHLCFRCSFSHPIVQLFLFPIFSLHAILLPPRVNPTHTPLGSHIFQLYL